MLVSQTSIDIKKDDFGKESLKAIMDG